MEIDEVRDGLDKGINWTLCNKKNCLNLVLQYSGSI